MSTEDKKTDNELIAAFMELRVKFWFDKNWYNVGGYWTDPDKLKYDTSWEWLMPVVEKIKTLAVTSKLPYEPFKTVTHTTVNADISTLYKRIVEFIKWYNDQNPK